MKNKNDDEVAYKKQNLSWNTTDIVISAVIGVASGFLFFGFNLFYNVVKGASLFYPPSIGLYSGTWVIAGILVMLIVQKPGAALFGELCAAFVSILFPNQWSFEALVSGFVQGLGAEIVFALFLYRRFSMVISGLSGFVGALGEAAYELFIGDKAAWASTSQIMYSLFLCISGFVLGGALAWFIVVWLQKTGVLRKLKSGSYYFKIV